MSAQNLKAAPPKSVVHSVASVEDLARFAPRVHAELLTYEQWRQFGDVSSALIEEVPHPDDVSASLDRSRVEILIDEVCRGRWLPLMELARNLFLLAPIIFTWLSLSLASAAFQQSVASYALAPGVIPPTFQQLWERGFDVPTVDWGLIHGIPLRRVRSDGSEWRWFTFSFVAGADAMIVTVLGALIAVAYRAQRRAEALASSLMDVFDHEVLAIRAALRALHLRAQNANADASRIAITSTLSAFTDQAQAVVATMTDGANMFRQAAESRLSGDKDLATASKTFVNGAKVLESFASRIQTAYDEQTTALRDVATSLTTLHERQNQTRIAIDAIVSELTNIVVSLVAGCNQIEVASARLASGNATASEVLLRTVATQADLAQSAQLLEATTRNLSDVLLNASGAVQTASESIDAKLGESRDETRLLLEDLSNRLETTTYLMVRSTEAAEASTRDLENIAADQSRAVLTLTTQFTEVLSVLRAVLATDRTIPAGRP